MFFDTLKQYLDTVAQANITNGPVLDNGAYIISSSDTELLRVSNGVITVAQRFNFEPFIIESKGEQTVNIARFRELISSIQQNIVRLNHCGFGYITSDFEPEVKKYLETLRGSPFNLYEENSGDQNNKWLFAGNAQNWSDPLFEIVLSRQTAGIDGFQPHFQIDLDTDLPIEELKCHLESYFGPGFIRWQLDIPDYGTVLVMGRAEDIRGTKIYLGFGTNLRDIKRHRTQVLKSV